MRKNYRILKLKFWHHFLLCLIILSGLSFSIGLLMNAISKVLSENRRFKYNSIK